MFTGIIEMTGSVTRPPAPAGDGLRFEIAPERPLADLQTGESIAINGVCQTAEPGSGPQRLIFFSSPETVSRTTLGQLKPGQQVNLERALRFDSRLGGHLVQGHVDGVGSLLRIEKLRESWALEAEFPPELSRYIAPKGSIAVDGISLTVVEVRESSFTVALIPHSATMTTLHAARAGQAVNLEVDMLARYAVNALLAAQGGAPTQQPNSLSKGFLREAGF